MVKWSDDYKLGIEEIDNQHKKFFDIADYTLDLLKDELTLDKYDRIIEILNELREYTKYHFKCEEDFMEKIKYKKFLSHKVEHEDFVNKLDGFDFSKIDQNQEHSISEILDMVFNWLVNHILKSDADIAKFYKEASPQ